MTSSVTSTGAAARKSQDAAAVFNVTLATALGVYRLLDPEPVVTLGGRNAHAAFVTLGCSYVCLVSVVMWANALKAWTVDVGRGNDAVLGLGVAEFLVFTAYKMLVVVRRGDEIWDCLRVTRFDFTSCGRRGCGGGGVTRLLRSWRHRTVLCTNVYAIACCWAVACYTLSPLLFRDRYSTIAAADGSTADYRLNVFNLYAGLSAHAYNAHFGVLYAAEASTMVFYLYFSVVVDTLQASLALALVCQLRTVNAAFERVTDRRQCRVDTNEATDHKIGFRTSEENCTVYNNLKAIVKEHQAVLKKLDNFFSVFRQMILLQIVTVSNVLIINWFTVLQAFMGEQLQADTGATIIKMMLACPVLTFQTFMACYLSELIYKEKESIIFALYNSNWTEMDLKCKKLILFTMVMNNAHKQKLKFSELKIVNLEMFLGTVRICYSVLSVMLNTNK